jgi:NADH:ubiquinone oxidoreductase subunit 5 (subunit L)/multisubunit Na+/H+ antiporter MnhA subunit
LFLAGGAVIHAAGPREIDSMGGLLKRLPWSGWFFLLGAIAICGLPPLNGFVSELLIYLGFFKGVTANANFASGISSIGAPALALIGGLALACFVKVFGVVFLGEPRKKLPNLPHEAPRSMLTGMSILATICLTIGLLPWLVAPMLQRAVIAWNPSTVPDLSTELSNVAHFGSVSAAAIALLVVVIASYGAFLRRLSKVPPSKDQTWGCGYTAPTPRMQYTASSFAEMLVGYFAMVLRPRMHSPKVQGVFPQPTHFESHVPETMLDLVYVPFLKRLYNKTAPIRHLQHGHLSLYILYMFITLIVLMFLIRA